MSMSETQELSRVQEVSGLNGVHAAAAIESAGDHNIVFTSLVTGDSDIVGLVAYSLYKQNKHDWIVTFNKLKGREPGDDETTAYILGEATQRRLATYRHLAQATLDGRGPVATASAVASNAPGEGCAGSQLSAEGASEHNQVFTNLVTGDSDILGLVAYSLYKQNKHDWLVGFRKTKERQPNENELAAYILGESTPRRLSTYRHLAEATLEGRGPTGAAGADSFKQRNYAIAARHAPAASVGPNRNWGRIGLIGLAVIAAIGVYLAGRFGMLGALKF